MAKWTLGILDGRGWGVDGVTTVCGRDWTGLYSCRMLRATMAVMLVLGLGLALRPADGGLGLGL